LQLSLRTLLIIMALAAIGAGAVRWYTEPFRRQRQAVAAIEKAGGSYESVAASRTWLRRLFGEDSFQNIVLVNVADCDDPSAFVDHLTELAALEILLVGGPEFKDEHLRDSTRSRRCAVWCSTALMYPTLGLPSYTRHCRSSRCTAANALP
jgi:hypothetical protein